MRQKHINEGDDRPGFAGAGCHDPQHFALVFPIFLASPLNGNFLIRSVRDFLIDIEFAEGLFLSATIDNTFHVPLGKHRIDFSRRIIHIVPKPCVIAVGIENQRTLPGHLLQAISIKPSLLTPNLGINTGSFRFHYSQRFVIVTVENIICPPFAGIRWHTDDLDFRDTIHSKFPAHFLEVNINDGAARIFLGFDGGSRHGKLMRRLVLFAKFGKLRFEICHLCGHGFPLFGLLGKFVF